LDWREAEKKGRMTENPAQEKKRESQIMSQGTEGADLKNQKSHERKSAQEAGDSAKKFAAAARR